MKKLLFTGLCAIVLLCASCAKQEYDISRGVNKEATLFTDQISFPIGDIGPITPKALLSGGTVGEMLKSFLQEDENGYFIAEKKEPVYSNPVMLISYMLPDASQPADVPITSFTGSISTSASALAAMGMEASPQVFSLLAGNPLTEEITFSGKLRLTDAEGADMATKEFSQVKVAASATDSELLKIEDSGSAAISGCQLDGLSMHLPADILKKDPTAGWGSFKLDYHYKAYITLAKDFPDALAIPVNDVNLPVAQYRVKELRIRAEVSNEIPVSLEIDGVDVKVNKTDEDGNTSPVTDENISFSTGVKIASGSSGNPVVSPVEIVIKAIEGTIPDICGLQIKLRILAPTGDGDKRLNMNQQVSFNNIRATISGGITIQGL